MSNFSILYPQLFFFDGIKTSTPSSPSVEPLITGAPRRFWRVTGEESLILVADAIQTPLLGVDNAISYMAIKGIAGLLDQVVSMDIDIEADSGGSPVASWSETVTSADLIGDMLYLPVIFSPVASDLIDEYTLTLDWGDDGIQVAISKIFMGVPFDFGCNPTYSESQTLQQEFIIAPNLAGELRFKSVAMDLVVDFTRYILPNTGQMTFILHDECSRILPKEFVYCKIMEPEVDYKNDRVADIRFKFIELL